MPFAICAMVPAEALVLRILKSRTLAGVPIVTNPVRLLAWVDMSISLAAAETVTVVVPGTVSAPD